ncbi:hypothetical protein K5X82_02280 [Halosquirtibacter xylanolyticus]|uniref:hypothetical protein n=1 Tax=Halosquirtibacter xylanolyticus TaxID=3374599 RepID=UPI0037498D08|nr:hypothetical protein K5X82_02280 [Prolixibacteraceae bacterium]
MIYIFSATNELEIANGLHSYTPAKHLRDFERDLSFLPYYFGEEGDILLMEQKPSDKFIESLKVLHLPNIRIHSMQETQQMLASKTINSKQKLAPWGWSPRMHHKLDSLKRHISLHPFEQKWETSYKEVYSRVFARDILKTLLSNSTQKKIYIDKNDIPMVITKRDEVHQHFQQHGNIVVKTPLSSSGRGMIFLHDDKIHDTYNQWIDGALKTHGYLMVEKKVNKLYDLSLHFEVKNNQIDYLGQASFFTLENGQYEGNNLQPFPEEMEDQQKEFVQNHIKQCVEDLLSAFYIHNLTNIYQGIIGVDLLLLKDAKGNMRLQPCLEMNMRYNMGTVTLALRKRLPNNVNGFWKVERLGRQDPMEFDRIMKQKYPLEIDNEGKIRKGYKALIEPTPSTLFACYMICSPIK